jgi:hypothetical protein
MQDTLDKEKFIAKLIIRKLQQDIDVAKEKIGVGKTLYRDMELDDEEEEDFVEMYCDIPLQRMQIYADSFGMDMKDCVMFFKETIKNRIVLIVGTIFKQCKKLHGLQPNLKDLEIDIGVEKGDFIVQINLTASEEE